ncbi:transaldolase family protein [Streptomyces telluris]|uniref:Transaldolase n=1 Tax=Streptomyces telluris TaxID=2720021 RepID=A0A9X2LK11_9ACTN|nr:transaldolase family protein [Streptomyces telluris]MCQ8772714.1 transaldolase [Streptomyces telluris]NJP81196.1 transaldolase [Streptomyces telluris]
MGERTVTSGGEVLRELLAEGVSPWLDGLRRSLLASGALARLVAAGEVRGATSDPGALAAEVADGTAYRQQLAHLACRSVPPTTAVQALCAYDLRAACDELRPVFAATRGLDGHVSMGPDPWLAGGSRVTADALADAAAALHGAACRPNALVKIPATDEGLAATGACLARGIGVHVTGIFSVRRYEQVVDVWFAGLERARAAGLDLSAIPSLASLPVARIDAEADARLRAAGRAGGTAAPGARDTASLAVARLVYRRYEEGLGSARWRVLAAAGARPQRLMWSVGSPVETEPRGVPYVESLVAWGTVSAMSGTTLAAAGRRGRLRGDTLTGQDGAARAAVVRFEAAGVSFDEVAGALESESAVRAGQAWGALRGAVADRLREGSGG